LLSLVSETQGQQTKVEQLPTLEEMGLQGKEWQVRLYEKYSPTATTWNEFEHNQQKSAVRAQKYIWVFSELGLKHKSTWRIFIHLLHFAGRACSVSSSACQTFS
jgi:hypothetical protein